MSKILNGFKSISGARFLKKEDSLGRTYYVQEGEGRVKSSVFHGAKRWFNFGLTTDGGLPPEVKNASSLSELEQVTNIPFTQRSSKPIRGPEAQSLAEKKRAEGNRWFGFWRANRDKYDSKIEGAKDYLRFRNEIDGADQSERSIIKRQYNLGGS